MIGVGFSEIISVNTMPFSVLILLFKALTLKSAYTILGHDLIAYLEAKYDFAPLELFGDNTDDSDGAADFLGEYLLKR
ncbi:MAG: hypothetical protein AAFW75_18665 [Cyanobacteria bacterium J06636_16]